MTTVPADNITEKPGSALKPGVICEISVNLDMLFKSVADNLLRHQTEKHEPKMSFSAF